MLKSRFEKYSEVPMPYGLTGKDIAERMLRENGITHVAVTHTPGTLTDHYNPQTHTINLSDGVYNSCSIAAAAVAAHETGHAIQHAKKYFPLVFRRVLVPIANIGSSAGPWLAILGIVMSFPLLTDIGILLFAGAVLFYLVTLPVEFNASNRALKILKQNNVLSSDELKGVKKVLSAAAMTYVASALVAMANFLRLVLISRNRRR